MKNFELLNITQVIEGLKSFNTSSAIAYKVYKFKKEIKKSFEIYIQIEQDLLKECSLVLNENIDEKFSILIEEGKEEVEKNIERYKALRVNALSEDVQIDCTKLNYEELYLLIQENKEQANLLEALEGVLWEDAPVATEK